jgi:hypothetical protein
MANKRVNIRINDNAPGGYAASEYRGVTMEAEVRGGGGNSLYYFPIQHGFTVLRDHATVVENTDTFQPKSGMVFLSDSGQMGLFVGTDKGLWMMFSNGSGYVTHTQFRPKMLGESDGYGTSIVRIWKGMNDYGNMALNSNLKAEQQGNVVWERQPTSGEVKLNGDYTAEVTKDKVVVGCQTIPMDKVREIVELADKLGKA